MPQLHTLLTGLAFGESPRWHDGRLWVADWGAQEILAVDSEGKREVIVKVDFPAFPMCFDWLPDGRLLIVSGSQAKLLRREPDGSLVTHADLSSLVRGYNEIVMDGRGNIYVNGSDYDFRGGGEFIPGIIALVTPDGSVRQIADQIAFPNGMVVTPDNSTLIIAESFESRLTAFDIAADGSLSNRRVWAVLKGDGIDNGGDGICMDAEGAIWASAWKDGRPACLRVKEGGEIVQIIELDLACFACMLGGTDGKTLFMMAAVWQGIEKMEIMFRSQTGHVLTAPAPAPHAGWP